MFGLTTRRQLDAVRAELSETRNAMHDWYATAGRHARERDDALARLAALTPARDERGRFQARKP